MEKQRQPSETAYIAKRIQGYSEAKLGRGAAMMAYQQLMVNARDEYHFTDEEVKELDAVFSEFFPSSDGEYE